MKVAFRVDASAAIGTGHVMRCLALADELRALGAEPSFVSRLHPGHLCDHVEASGFPVARLPAPAGKNDGPPPAHAAWLGATQADDAAQTAAALGRADWLVVDHYALDERWETRLRERAGRLAVLDDLADRRHDCDLLLDQNHFPDAEARYAGRVPARCHVLLGPRYALLRAEFAQARAGAAPRSGRIERAAVYFGGADGGGNTLKAIEALAPLGLKAVTVVTGAANPRADEIRRRAAAVPGMAVVPMAASMSRLMLEADVFLGAGGTTSWERACLGLPSVVVAIAENQVGPSRALADAGGILYLGADAPAAAMRQAVETLRADPALAKRLSAAGAALCDGRGAPRVARLIAGPAVALRPAAAADEAALLAWRNAPENRRHFFQDGEVSPPEHARWLAAVLRDPDRLLLIAESGGRPRGVLRYDCAGERATVSIHLVPGEHGAGWGPRMLLAGNAWLRQRRPAIREIRAEIRSGNTASERAFRDAGFRGGEGVYIA